MEGRLGVGGCKSDGVYDIRGYGGVYAVLSVCVGCGNIIVCAIARSRFCSMITSARCTVQVGG